MTGFLNGVVTAMVTPFSENGVNSDELKKMLEYQIDGGASAVVVLGTTGEPSTMDDAERDAVIKCAVKTAAGRVKVIAGTGANCTEKAVAYSKRACELGVDGVLAVTPYYNKCTQKGLFEYYAAICNAVSNPVIAYNVPSRTGVNLLPETAAKLAEISNFAGIKEASGNMAQISDIARRIRGKCDLYSGDDSLALPVFAIGGAAIISVVSNIAPSLVKKLCDAYFTGDCAEAVRVHDKLFPLIAACFTEVNPIPIKAACNLIGFNVGTVRAPLTELEDCNKKILRAEMKKAGLKVV